MNFPRGLVTFMFVDVEGSTLLATQLPVGDVASLMRAFETSVNSSVAKHSGSVKERVGDEILAVFQTQQEALESATEIMRDINTNATSFAGKDGRRYSLKVRIGIGASETDFDPETFLHPNINLTHRIAEMAVGDQILVTDSVRSRLSDPSYGEWFTWEGLRIRNHDGPQKVHELLWDGQNHGAPARRFIPDELRSSSKIYIGCEDVIEEIATWAESGHESMFLLHGTGGMGKTTTAIRAALRVWDRFEGGVKFIPFDTLTLMSAEEATAETLVSIVAESVGAPEKVLAEGGEALIQFFKSSLPMLLVFDNFESIANGETNEFLALLFERTNIRVLATSQHHVSPQGATKEFPQRPLKTPRSLDDIESSEVYGLFLARSSMRGQSTFVDRSALLRVLNATQGLPLAVELLASHTSDATLLEIANGVEKAQLDWMKVPNNDFLAGAKRHQSLEACISWSISRLPRKQQEMVLKMAPFEYPFTRDDAERLAKIKPEMLRDWARWSLLNRFERDGVSIYEIPSSVRMVLRIRVGELYTGLSRSYYRYFVNLVIENRGARPGNSMWKALDHIWRPALKGLLDAGTQRGLAIASSPTLIQFLFVTSRLSEAQILLEKSLDRYDRNGYTLHALAEVARMRSQNDVAVRLYEEAMPLFVETHDKLGQASCIKGLGTVARMRSQLDEAVRLYEKAMPLFVEARSKRGQATCIQSLGDVARMRSQYHEAVRLYEEAMPLFVQAQDRLGQANCIKSLGDIARMRSQYEVAVGLFEEAMLHYGEAQDKLGQANCIKSLGDVAAMRSEHEEAVRLYGEAMLLFVEVQDKLGQANCIQSLGDVAAMRSQHEEAVRKYEEALNLYAEVQSKFGQANCTKSLGDVAAMRYKYEEAVRLYEEAMPLFVEIQDKLGQANCIKSLGDVAGMRSEYEEAVRLYDDAMPLFVEIQDKLGQASCIGSLGDVAVMRSQYDVAVRLYKDAMLLFVEVQNKLGQANCLQSLGDVARMRSQNGEAVRLYEEAMRLYMEVQEKVGQANCIQGLGDVAATRSQYEEAVRLYNDAMHLFVEIQNKQGKANCIKGLGDVAAMRSQYEEATRLYEEAMVLFVEIQSKLGQANCIKGFGDIAATRSQYDEAARLYKKAMPLFVEVQSTLGQADYFKSLGDLARMRSQDEAAISLYEKAMPHYVEAQSKLGQANCTFGSCRSKVSSDVPIFGNELSSIRRAYEQCDNRLGVILTDYIVIILRQNLPIEVSSRQILSQLDEISAFFNKGEVLLDVASRHVSSSIKRELYSEALAIFSKIRNEHFMGEALLGLAKVSDEPEDRTRHIASARSLWSTRPDLAFLLPKLANF